MRRLKDYLNILAWQAGLAYIALWVMTFVVLARGPAFFASSGTCWPDAATVLFYWTCDPASPLSIAAAFANVVLTATVWAPVFFAAATVRPEALILAVPIAFNHLIGLPTAIFVVVRLMLMLLALPRQLLRRAPEPEPAPVRIKKPPPPRPPRVKSRSAFGQRRTP